MAGRRGGIVVYGHAYCPFTVKAARLAGVPVSDPAPLLGGGPAGARLLAMRRQVREAGHRTIPMCFDGGRFVGGCAELEAYLGARARPAPRVAKGRKKLSRPAKA